MIDGSIDSNVVLRLLVREDPAQHEAARRLLASGEFVVPDVAVIETCFVLGRIYRLGRDQQVHAMLGFLAQPNIHTDLARFVGVFANYVGHPKLSLENCYLVAVANDDGPPLFTFDRKLAGQVAGATLVE